MRQTILFIILILSTTACSVFGADAFYQQQAIFSAEQAQEQRLELVVGTTVDRFWTPTQAEMNTMYNAMITYMDQTGQSTSIMPYPSYKHQHFGYISEGKQYIYNNYFCDTFDDNWQSNFVGVDDGGNCFFQTTYDVTNNEIISLYINGEA